MFRCLYIANSNKYIKSIKFAPSHIEWIDKQRRVDREFGLSRLIRTLMDRHLVEAAEVEKDGHPAR